MKKDIRKYITYKGKTIVAIDLSCSQPILSTILFSKNFYNNKVSKTGTITINDLNDNINIQLEHLKNKDNTINPMCVKMLECVDSQESDCLIYNDVMKYKDAVSEGTFYEYIQSSYNKKYGLNITRSNAKELIISILFADNYDHRPVFKRNRTFFKEIYPSVYALFDMIKSKSYPTLAILLQKIESVIFLDRIAKRILKEHRHIPILTIHDSICTTLEHKDIVYKIIREEVKRAIGITPNLKFEYWQ